MFVSSEKFIEAHSGKLGDISIYGQESNYTTWRLAKMNLAIRGIEADYNSFQIDGNRPDFDTLLSQCRNLAVQVCDVVFARFPPTGPLPRGNLDCDTFLQPPADGESFQVAGDPDTYLSYGGVRSTVCLSESMRPHAAAPKTINRSSVYGTLHRQSRRYLSG